MSFCLGSVILSHFISSSTFREHKAVVVWKVSDSMNEVWGSCGTLPGIILGLGSANDKRYYYVMPSFIGWDYNYNDPWFKDIISQIKFVILEHTIIDLCDEIAE